MMLPKGKHVHIDINNPQAVGICDRTGLPFLRKDLIRQMEWRGNALVWTGSYVGRPYLNEPNQQGRNPMLPADPIPVDQPRVPGPDINAPSNPETIVYLKTISFQN